MRAYCREVYVPGTSTAVPLYTTAVLNLEQSGFNKNTLEGKRRDGRTGASEVGALPAMGNGRSGTDRRSRK